MAKDGFSAAEIFNTRIDDEYTADPIVDDVQEPEIIEEFIEEPLKKEEPSVVVPEEPLKEVPLVNIVSETEESFVFEREEEIPQKEIKIDFSKIKEKVSKIKLPPRKKKLPKNEPEENIVEEVIIEELLTPQKRK